MNYYPNYNQYYQPQMRVGQPMQPIQPIQPMQQQQIVQQPMAQPIQAIGLQGKSVESIDVVKAMDIPLDGSVSYFPLTDGSAIVSKQLQQDGTSKTIIYKPIIEKEEEVKYVTFEDLDKKIKEIDFSEIEEELEDIKKQLKNMKKNKEE